MAQKHSTRRAGRRAPVGAPPGTFRIDPHAPPTDISVMAYGPDTFTEREVRDLSMLPEFLGQSPVTWVNVNGLGDEPLLRRLQEIFGLHPLALADVVNVTQRAKVEAYGEHLFIVTRMSTLSDRVETEQLSCFLGPNFVLTFQEHPGDCLDVVRDRIRNNVGRIRTAGPDYLVYALLDSVIDAYYPLLEQYGERLEKLEERVITDPREDSVYRIRRAKRDLLTLRRAVWPQREAVNTLMRDPLEKITDDTRLYLRDSYDHVIQLMDVVENHREMAAGLQDVYMSAVSNRMNEVMKVLTVIATIFIPLTFIAGIYGMNFDPDVSRLNMPELRWAWGYPVALAVMGLIAVIMVICFWRKGWLGGSKPRDRDRTGP